MEKKKKTKEKNYCQISQILSTPFRGTHEIIETMNLQKIALVKVFFWISVIVIMINVIAFLVLVPLVEQVNHHTDHRKKSTKRS